MKVIPTFTLSWYRNMIHFAVIHKSICYLAIACWTKEFFCINHIKGDVNLDFCGELLVADSKRIFSGYGW